MGVRVGVEVGGTFTDIVAIAEGRIRVGKVPSTPARPDDGALAAIDSLGLDLSEVEDLVHGSTVATNAILERKGTRICLLTTAGMRDVIFLQRHNRERIYDLYYKKPEPVVRRRDVFEVAERIDGAGRAVTPLDEAEVDRLVRAVVAPGNYGAVAICFLNGFANPAHEQAVAEIVRARCPGLPVTCSHEVCAEFREYERASTTTLSAYVQPVIDSYLRRFGAALESRGHRGRVSVMQSNGGRLPAAAMGRSAITSLFSGPAAGVIGAARMAARAGRGDLITLDMGGTSTDVCLVERGTPEIAGMTEIDGLPIKTPLIDIATVGAGGGSVVWLDDGGMLRVGPHSAGASPGPACYGRGGRDPTVTDAHMVRGTIRAQSFLGGRMAIDHEAARQALAPLADKLGLSVEAAADGAIRVAESNIVRAIQRISTARGKDPRDYALVAFGGAGPMLAARIAEELSVGTVIVPPHAGVLSAWGLLAADFVHYESRTHRLPVEPEAMADVRRILAELRAAAQSYLKNLGLTGRSRADCALEMRYIGQAFEVAVPMAAEAIETIDHLTLLASFRAAHRRIFEFDKAAEGAAEIVTFRVAVAVPPPPPPPFEPEAVPKASVETIEVCESGAHHTCTVVARGAGSDTLRGPSLIEDETSTIYVPPGWRAVPDDGANLILTRTG